VQWVRSGHGVTVITTAPNFPEGKLFAGYKNRWYTVEDMDGIRVVRVKTYITANTGFARRTLDYLSFMVGGFCCRFVAAAPGCGCWYLAAVFYRLWGVDGVGFPAPAVCV